MSGDRSISVGRDATGSILNTGDNNRVDAAIEARGMTTLPPAHEVNINRELEQSGR